LTIADSGDIIRDGWLAKWDIAGFLRNTMTLMFTASSLTGQIDVVLPRVAKPARYMGGELNSIVKPPDEVSVRVALAFPDIYEVGMSNLGLRILYHVLNSQADVAAERVFAPAMDMEEEMRNAGTPLFSLESSLPVKKFDLIGFSLAYEMSYTTVLNMLDLAGIPVLASERADDDPIVIAGGHCATNPEPMADFIDAFVIGDGEEVILDVIDAYRENKGDRKSVLKALSVVEGAYVPATNSDTWHLTPDTQIRARRVVDLENAPFPDRLIVPFTEAVHDRVTLEIMRGCSRGCRFCQAGMITRPVRERSLPKLCEQAKTLLDNTGYEEVALTSLSSADYSGIGELVHTLISTHESDKVGISLPSLRADAGCVYLAAEIQRVRKSGLTFAPEAGTQRLRDVINKNVSEEDLLNAVEAAVECGWRRIKLYFMIGLPTETDEDLEGIGRLVTHVIDIGRKHRTPLTLNVTISPFVPKPHTPFQWRAMDTLEELEHKIALIRPLLRGKNISLSWHDPRSSRVEAALARGDRRLGRVVQEVWKNGGKLEQDNYNHDRWQAAFEFAGLDITEFANREIPKDAPLPWDHISVGVSKKFLAREDDKASNGETTPDCRFETCAACGLKEVFGQCKPPEIAQWQDYPKPEIQEPLACNTQPAGPFSRVLITFTKGESVKWFGHLDLMRVFERAVRMSGINIAYSQGFNPRAKMSIASALPLGATADAELITLNIIPPIDLKDIISRLQRALPSGIALTDAQILPDNVKGVIVTGSELLVKIALPDEKSADNLKDAIARLMSKSEIIRKREKRGSIDIRPGIASIELHEPPKGCSALIRMTLRHLEFTVKPAEIIDELSKDIPGIGIVSIHRMKLITLKVDSSHSAI